MRWHAIPFMVTPKTAPTNKYWDAANKMIDHVQM
jgi:hypothetical protein